MGKSVRWILSNHGDGLHRYPHCSYHVGFVVDSRGVGRIRGRFHPYEHQIVCALAALSDAMSVLALAREADAL